MPTPSNLDGVLVQWGDRLFYPANRVVRARTPNLTGAGTHERAHAIRQRIPANVIISGIVLACLVAVSIYGNGAHFGVIHVPAVDLSLLWPGSLVSLGSGVAGGLFARLLIVSLSGGSADGLSRWRLKRPVSFAAACGLAVAVIGVTTNVPAGIFAPSLAIGAALGNDIAKLTSYPQAATLIALGMAGFLAAATQAPLTAFIIVMEMVDGHAMVLSLMACALIASGISRVMSRPLCATLAQIQLRRLPQPQPESATPPQSERRKEREPRERGSNEETPL